MSISLGAVCNLYNEATALPGWLECILPFFDDVRVLHSGPGGKPSTDGTLEILAKWHIPVLMGSLDDGFGAVRTKAVRSSPCEWVMLMDTDERFLNVAQELTCTGASAPLPVSEQVLQEYDTPTEGACPWNLENIAKFRAELTVHRAGVYDQGAWLRDLLEHGGYDAFMAIRRHWRDFSYTRPTQNWHTDPDLQTRIVRNVDSVYWTGKMHENLVGAKKVGVPSQQHGPFLEHLHVPLRMMEPGKRAEAIEAYRRLWSTA